MLVGKWKWKVASTVGKVGSRLGLARPALTFVVSDFFPTSYLQYMYRPIKFFLDFCIPRRTIGTVTTSDKNMLLPYLSPETG